METEPDRFEDRRLSRAVRTANQNHWAIWFGREFEGLASSEETKVLER
jgi:tRNA C32,U32 (ribose-2'-O)-methylase TrmJ